MCLSAKPVVDGLERELQGRAQVVRLNIQEEVGRAMARRFGVELVPTFIVFDGQGREVWRQSGRFPNRGAILQAVARAHR